MYCIGLYYIALCSTFTDLDYEYCHLCILDQILINWHKLILINQYIFPPNAN